MKSEAGLRTLPVPTAIAGLVKRLAARRDSEGYLLCSGAKSKWGVRGSPLGQRFSKLKTRMGYGPRHTFHSLRHTFLSLLAHAGCPLDMVRDLGGHENGGDTMLGYIDPSELLNRLHWLDTAIRFDSAQPDTDDDED
jgi:integrase